MKLSRQLPSTICKWCGKETYMIAERQCVFHSAMFIAIESNLAIAKEMIQSLSQSPEDQKERITRLDKTVPQWREQVYSNGARMYGLTTGILLTPEGVRSIFDDVDQ